MSMRNHRRINDILPPDDAIADEAYDFAYSLLMEERLDAIWQKRWNAAQEHKPNSIEEYTWMFEQMLAGDLGISLAEMMRQVYSES